jgi:hypothetical protein
MGAANVSGAEADSAAATTSDASMAILRDFGSAHSSRHGARTAALRRADATARRKRARVRRK